MKTLEICPVCCEGTLQEYTFGGTLSYKNYTICIHTFESSKCDVCGSSVATHAQTKKNKLTNINYQRSLDGLLTTHDIVRIRKKLGLNQKQASEIIGGGGIAFSKYENGTLRQTVAMDNLLRALDKNPKLIDDLKSFNIQRRAFPVTDTEIVIPTEPKLPIIEPSTVGLIDKLVNSAQTIFKPLLTSCNSLIPDTNNQAAPKIFGLNL
ncbi:type II toxin-antitoxin system MqsA family antitoxin [Ectopseudomonas hydrolytica]|uniref:type II toxin-antitoxin system MqsA family antitoxin n=1 Tax=Ectopseudomonas hydrolytica TaxID=2493633 RepID=UPI00376F3863